MGATKSPHPHAIKLRGKPIAAWQSLTMDATITFPQSEIEAVVRGMVPMRIDLSSEDEGTRTIDIDAVHTFTLVPDRGARATGNVRVEWPVLGIGVPLSIEDLCIDVLITLQGNGDDTRLSFQFEIQTADIRNLPGFIEKPIIAKVNDALSGEATILAWSTGKTLSTNVALPKMLQPQRHFQTRVTQANLAITTEGLTLSANLASSVA